MLNRNLILGILMLFAATGWAQMKPEDSLHVLHWQHHLDNGGRGDRAHGIADTTLSQYGMDYLKVNYGSPLKEYLAKSREVLDWCLEIKDSLTAGRVYTMMQFAYKDAGQLDKALRFQKLAILHYGDDSTRLCRAYLNLTQLYSEMGKPTEQAQSVDKAELYARKDPLLLGTVRNSRAIDFAQKGKIDSAAKQFEACLQLFVEAGDSLQVANVANNLGNTYVTLGREVEGIQLLQRSAKIDEEGGNLRGLATQYFNISRVYKRIGDLDGAIEYVDLSHASFKELGNPAGMVRCLTKKAGFLRGQDKFEEAYKLDLAAQDTCLKYGIQNYNLGDVYLGLAHYHRYEGKPQAAWDLLVQAEEIFKESGRAYLLPANYMLMGQVLRDMGKDKEALEYLEKGLTEGNVDMPPLEHRDLQLFLAELYEEDGQHKNALKHLRIAYQLTDSLQDAAMSEAVAEVQAQFDVARYRNDLEVERRVSAERQLENAQQANLINRLLLGGVLLLAIGAGSFFWLRYRNQKREWRDRQLLEEEQREKARLHDISRQQAQEIGRKNKLLTELKAQVDQLQERHQDVNPEEFVHLFKLIEHNIHSAEEWDAFKANFEQIFPDFLPQLIAQHGELSPAELRLCTLVRLGMNQKEIAQVLGIHPDSVKRSRNRLRQRLGLAPEQSLKAYLGER